MNPGYFATSPVRELFQTLVHEQVHLWQQVYGTPSRAGYHNKEWADKMNDVGLIPSATGQPGGAQTGQSMSDYPQENGAFLKACEGFLSGGHRLLPLVDRLPAARPAVYERPGVDPDIAVDDIMETVLVDLVPEIEVPAEAEKKAVAKRKIRYSCPGCQSSAWGKPNLNLICGDCRVDMPAVCPEGGSNEQN